MEEDDDERKPLLEPSRLSIQYPGTLTNDQCRTGAKLIANGGAVRSSFPPSLFMNTIKFGKHCIEELSLALPPSASQGQKTARR